MIYESAMNYLSKSELSHGNGIQTLINKLKDIQKNPSGTELSAIADFAAKLTRLTPKRIPKHVTYDSHRCLWVLQREIKGKVYRKASQNRNELEAMNIELSNGKLIK